MNIAVVYGVVLAKPVERVLATGEFATAFDVVTESDDGRFTVPVNWVTTVKSLVCEGDELLVVGRVRRRFYQSGGSVQSRTELLASEVLPARRKAAQKKALISASEEIYGHQSLSQ